MDWISEYLEELKQRVADRRLEESPAAGVYAHVVRELEERRDAALATLPTIPEAAAESGYSPEQLRKLRRDGVWSGQRHDLPRRPAKRLPESRRLTLSEEILMHRVDAERGRARSTERE
jgi:hypothetical protein